MSRAHLWGTDAVESRLPDTWLRKLLRLNAAFSATTGIVGLAAPGRVARTLGVDATWVIRALGVGLVLYAVDLLVVATLRHRRLVPLGRAASAADAAWVAGTGVVVATGAVSTGGALVLVLLAIPVGALAAMQWRAAGVIELAALATPSP